MIEKMILRIQQLFVLDQTNRLIQSEQTSRPLKYQMAPLITLQTVGSYLLLRGKQQ